MSADRALGSEPASADDAARIVGLELDQRSIVRWGAEVEHERNVAVFDLLEANSFAVADFPGPYRLTLSLRETNLVLDIARDDRVADGAPERCEVLFATRALRGLIKDYFLICDSYFTAIKGATPSRIESLDMARRGLHDEGSQALREALAERVTVDHDTARRLFTLLCVLHIRS